VTVASPQRFNSRTNPCPVCGGGADLPSGNGSRCYGFLSSDGAYAHCTREVLAGPLPEEDGGTYPHRLKGDCRCGQRHDGATDQNGSTPKGEPVATYNYGGALKERFELPDGTKFFRWPKGTRMADMPLYGADRLTDGPVIFCEGEKACEALWRAGFQAVTNAGGAKQKDFGIALEVLRGHDVYQWADNDPDGVGLMSHVAVLLPPIAKSLHRITWTDAPPKGDAFDALTAGVDVQALIDDAKRIEASDGLPRPIAWGEFWATDHKAEDFLLDPLLPRGKSIAVFAPGGGGKSEPLLYCAACLATGRRVLDTPAGACVDVIYVDKEMAEGDVAERLDAMGFGSSDDLSHLHYFLLPDLPPLDTPDGGQVLLALARKYNAQLVIIDTLIRVLSGGENDADTLRNFHTFTGQPLKALGITVVRLDHTGRDLAKGARGTSAKQDDIDLSWLLTMTDNGTRLKATKRRQSWIPETVDLVRIEDPLRYEVAVESWPAGTADLARLMDDLGIAIDCPSRKAQELLKQAGKQRQRTLVLAALKYRIKAGNHTRNHPLSPNGNHLGNHSGNRIWEPLGNHSEPLTEASGTTGSPYKGNQVPSPVAEPGCERCGKELGIGAAYSPTGDLLCAACCSANQIEAEVTR